MSDMLGTPETQKFSTVFETSHLRVGCCSMQGWRKSMEDAHIAQLNVDGKKNRAFFGVFDGHQSDEAARYCRSHMFDELSKTLSQLKTDSEGGTGYVKAFEDTFKRVDDQICQKYASSGTAANCVLLADGNIICANAGDSRAVLYRDQKVVVLSHDHKPNNPEEEARIKRAGSSVENGRVNMALAVSRALGDVDFKCSPALSWKEQAVTAYPDSVCLKSKPEDNFIIIACDGVWDVLSNAQCCELVYSLLHPHRDQCADISLVCENVLDRCLAQSNSVREGTDNMTIIIVEFKPTFFASLS